MQDKKIYELKMLRPGSHRVDMLIDALEFAYGCGFISGYTTKIVEENRSWHLVALIADNKKISKAELMRIIDLTDTFIREIELQEEDGKEI